MTLPHKALTKVGTILYPILYIVLLFLIATAIYLYANGYRVDIFKKSLVQSGVLGVESSPTGAEIYIDEELLGKTPKSTSLEVGTYHVELKLEGYHDWTKDIDIVEGKSTPIYPWLVRRDPTSTIKWTSTGTMDKYWVSPYYSHILILTKEETNFKLWEYTLNPALWDLSSNPSVILELDSNLIDITMSPSGQLALLKIQETKPSYYIIDTNTKQTLDTLVPLDITPSDLTTVTWSNNNKYLILESTESITAYDIKLGTITTTYTKDPLLTYTWTTDDSEFLYIVEDITTGTTTHTYRLKQLQLDGTSTKYIIENFYFSQADEYINQYRQSGFASVEFASSPESTLSAGAVDFIEVNQKAQGMYIRTTLATYWYNMESQKFLMISAFPASLIAFNPNSRELLFQDSDQIGLFTFDKTDGDHTTNIGTKMVKNITDITKVQGLRWLATTYNIVYSEGGNIYIADRDGANRCLAVESSSLITLLVRDSQGVIVAFSSDEQNRILVTEYDIH